MLRIHLVVYPWINSDLGNTLDVRCAKVIFLTVSESDNYERPILLATLSKSILHFQKKDLEFFNTNSSKNLK